MHGKEALTLFSSLLRPPRSPFAWHIHGSPLTLNLYFYGRDIDDEDMISCYVTASQYVDDVIRVHGHGQISPSIQLSWAHGSASFTVHQSPRMTYENLFNVITGVEVFQLTYGYFETNFEIVHNTKGQVGSGEVRSTRPYPASMTNSTSASLRVDDISPNISAPLSPLPNAPFLRRIRSDAPLDLNITTFGHKISEADVLTCYASAAIYLKLMIEVHGDVAIPVKTSLHWAHGSASLTIQYKPRMTWATLADVLSGLSLFQMKYDNTETTFDILEGGENLGSGSLTYRDASQQQQHETSLLLPSSQITNISSLLTTPRDPTTIRVRNTPITLTFSAYGRALPPEDFLLAINQITFRIIHELLKPDGKDKPIDEELQWRWRAAFVLVRPEKEMTWGVLGTAIEGVVAFGMQTGWLSCDFEVQIDEVGPVGRGFVAYV